MLYQVALRTKIVALCAFIGCQIKPEALPVDDTNALTLITEWPFNRSWSGVYTDPITKEDWIFSGDPNTHLKVRVFNESGGVIREIPLGPVIDSLGGVNSLTLFAPDSLFVLSQRGTQYAIVDEEGKVARIQTLRDFLCDPQGDLYDVNGYSSGLAWLSGSLFLGTDWVSRCQDTMAHLSVPLEILHRRYFSEATKKCKLAQIRVSDPASGIRFGACDILPHLTDTPRCTIGVAGRMVANGKLFAFSPYSPFVFQLDTATLLVKRKISVHIAGGTVGIFPPPITATDIKNEGYNLRSATMSTVVSFLYDKPSQRYLAAVYHEVPEDTPESQIGAERSWSLIALDSTFTQIEEYVLHGSQYRSYASLSTKKGTWLLVANSGRQEALQPKVFHRLRL